MTDKKHEAITTIGKRVVKAMSLWGIHHALKESGMKAGETAIIRERDGDMYSVILNSYGTFSTIVFS